MDISIGLKSSNEINKSSYEQPSYKKLVGETFEVIQSDVKKQEELYKSCKNQIINVNNSLLKVKESLSKLISKLKGVIEEKK